MFGLVVLPCFDLQYVGLRVSMYMYMYTVICIRVCTYIVLCIEYVYCTVYIVYILYYLYSS